jgi:hypothetical protein
VSPRQLARGVALGRVAFGVAMLLAPKRVATGWVGAAHAERPGVQALTRSIGIRDLVIGMIALHTIDHPEVGPRWQATCAVVDSVDLFATAAARADLPAAGVAGTSLVAGSAAAAGFWCARELKRA